MHAICLSTLLLRSGIMLGFSAIQGSQERPPRGADKDMAAKELSEEYCSVGDACVSWWVMQAPRGG